jgi:hypothetical protein
MKTLGLVLAMVALVGGSCLASSTVTASFSVNTSGYALIALPQVPVDPAVGGTQASNQNGDPNGVFGQIKTSSGFTLQTWTGGGYSTWGIHSTTFGGMLLGAGYWVSGSALPSSGVVSYAALPDGVPDMDSNGNAVLDSVGYPVQTDMYISLPGLGLGTGGWIMIGHPFNHVTAINPSGSQLDGSRILFTDGTTTLGWKAAVTAGWVGSTLQKWTGGGYSNTGYNHGQTNTLTPGSGYWIQTYKDNLAMIIPGMEIGQ